MRTPKASLLAVSCLLMVVAFPGPASSDPIFISEGFLLVTGSSGGGRIELVGERGFALNSSVSTIAGIFDAFRCRSSFACVPGAEQSIRAFWSGNALHGDLIFEGQTHGDLGGPNSPTQAAVEFFGSFVVPAMGSAVVTTPFGFAGRFSIPNEAGTPGVPHSLSGQGTATITLIPYVSNPNAWSIASVRYDFSPVPEPGTILLVGLGIAGVARRAIRRKRNGAC